MCRVAGIDCYYMNNAPVGTANKRRRIETAELERASPQVSSPAYPPGRRHRSLDKSLDTLIDEESDLTHIVGPLIADDAKVVHQHCSPEKTSRDNESHYRVFLSDTTEPILYTKACRRRPGQQSSPAAGAQQRIIMEQILGDCTKDLVSMYVAMH